jgi:hypothetical protein
MEFWVNGSLPADINDLSKLLGYPAEEVKESFSKLHYSFFDEVDGQLISNELEEYRKGFIERREKQRLGGLLGAENKKAKQSKKGESKANNQEGQPQGQPLGSLTYLKSNQIKSNQLINKGDMSDSNKAWLEAAFDETPKMMARDYSEESRGY